MQPHAGRRARSLEGLRGDYRQTLVEEAVAAEPVTGEAADIVRDRERRVAISAGVRHPGGLARRVVRHLILEENVRAALAAPDHLRLLVVLDEQAVGRDVVAGNDDAVITDIAGPADAGAMVGPPGPDVVEYHVRAVHHQAVGRLAWLGAADPEVDVLHQRRIVRAGAWAVTRGADLQQDGGVHRSGVEDQARELDAGHASDAH